MFFQDFLAKGKESAYADLFITLDKIWPEGEPVQADIDKVFLRRPKPYSTFTIEKTGESVSVWTTFGKEDPSEQIDLDMKSPKVKQLLTDFFVNFNENNVKMVRLDAVGFVIKKMGPSCFFVEPEIYEFLDWIKALADKAGVELLPEVHAHYQTQSKLAARDFWIYDFILPYTVLDTMLNGSSEKLAEYLKIRPSKQFTMLDCHDGIPVLPDLQDLIDVNDARKVVDQCVKRGSTLSLIVSDEHKGEGGFDVHQIGGTYYEVLGRDDDAYLAAWAIQFFAPGIPQVYYVGLLAGENDYDAVKQTGENRAMNRHNYTLEEIEQSLKKPVVQRLLKLIRFRNVHPAFQGEFSVIDAPADEVRLSWHKDHQYCSLYINLVSKQTMIEHTDEQGSLQTYTV